MRTLKTMLIVAVILIMSGLAIAEDKVPIPDDDKPDIEHDIPPEQELVFRFK